MDRWINEWREERRKGWKVRGENKRYSPFTLLSNAFIFSWMNKLQLFVEARNDFEVTSVDKVEVELISIPDMAVRFPDFLLGDLHDCHGWM